MFTRMLVLRRIFSRAGILKAAARVLAIEDGLFGLAELTTKRHIATAMC